MPVPINRDAHKGLHYRKPGGIEAPEKLSLHLQVILEGNDCVSFLG
jgi:hypothetical protein